MARAPIRTTADLSADPDLVVIYLGMRVDSLRGLPTLLSFGPKIRASVAVQPEGLLLHENVLFSVFPPHAGMRQYWRDFDALERWARSMPHQQWWQQFLRDRGGTGFWHETYSGTLPARRHRVDLHRHARPRTREFAPVAPARRAMFSARRRLGLHDGSARPPAVSEAELDQR